MRINEDKSSLSVLSKVPISIEDIIKSNDYNNSINERRYLLSETGVSPRVFNSWKNLGLIPYRKEEERKWNKFNFPEFLWLKIIQELREFGLSIEKIKMVYELLFGKDFKESLEVSMTENDTIQEIILQQSLQSASDIDPESLLTTMKEIVGEINLLELMITNSVLNRKNIGLIIYSSGECIPWFEEYYDLGTDVDQYLEKPHIFIKFSTLIFDFLFDEKRENYISPLKLLSKEELEILSMLKTNDLKEIRIKFSNTIKPNVFELAPGDLLPRQETERITKSMFFKNYQNISIKTNNNKTVNIEVVKN